jgi:hypothetical protein
MKNYTPGDFYLIGTLLRLANYGDPERFRNFGDDLTPDEAAEEVMLMAGKGVRIFTSRNRQGRRKSQTGWPK